MISINWIAIVLGGVLLSIILEFVAELILGATTTPIRRPIWTAFRQARWPWPAGLMVAFGVACSFAGAQLFQQLNATKSAEAVGIYLFLGGALVVLAAPALWLEARKVRR